MSDTTEQTDTPAEPITYREIEEAHSRVRDAILTSPCNKSETLSERTGAQVYLKLENLQRTAVLKNAAPAIA